MSEAARSELDYGLEANLYDPLGGRCTMMVSVGAMIARVGAVDDINFLRFSCWQKVYGTYEGIF